MNTKAELGGATGLLALGSSLGVAAAALATRAVRVAGAATSAAAGVEDWVELAIVAVAALAAAWVALGAVLGLAVVVAAHAGARWRTGEAALRAIAPGVVHRLVRAGIGMGVGAGLVLTPATAMAAPPSEDPATVTVDTSSVPSGVIDLGWRATATAPQSNATDSTAAPTTPAAAPAASPVARTTLVAQDAAETVVVVRGDTLWDIAARWLGGEPTPAEVLAATVRWHEANRDVIGDDADVILPGQILTAPA